MKILTLACFVTLLWRASGNSTLKERGPDVVEIRTSKGPVEGFIYDRTVNVFLGIPYATPPVGCLRFLRPRPVQPWYHVREVKTQPAACVQYTDGPFPWYDNMTGQSEDCLYLDIYTPIFSQKGSKLAVMFWIYGGGYTLGSNRLDVYDGRTLAAQEGTIVVTVNYRLGALGFLTSNTEDAPGNMGLYDVVMALQWVNENIQYFGGDKERITIFGESGGASISSSLCVSPLTKGLFSGAILQSASITKHIYNKLDSNLALTQRLAEAVDCAREDYKIYDYPRQIVQCLRGKDAKYLAKTLSSFFPYSTGSFSPQYGDSVLPKNAAEEIRKGNFHNIPILTGILTDEGSALLTMVYTDELGFFGEKATVVDKPMATRMLKTAFANFTDPHKYIDYYLKHVPDYDYDQIRKQVLTAYGDTIINCPTIYFAEKYAEYNNDVYFYFFNHRPVKITPWAGWMGVVHFEEVQYVFGRPLRVPQDYTSSEVHLSAQVMKVWADFANYGYIGKLYFLCPKWPKYSKENPVYVNMDTWNFGSFGSGPSQENCNFLRSYFGF